MKDPMEKVMTLADATPDANAEDPADSLIRLEINRAIASALKKLSTQQRRVFILTDIHEMTQAEAGEILGISENTVKVHVGAARKRLVKLLKPYYQDLVASS